MVHADVVVVGGGPAGAACAWRLRRHGLDCLVLDKDEFPRHKLCAGWIGPAVLEDLEVTVSDYPGGLTTFDALYISIRGLRIKLRTRQHAIVRYEFDDWLLRRSGAPFKVHDVKKIESVADGYLIDGEVSCRILVGAGGTYCPVRRLLFKSGRARDKASLIVAMEEEFRYDWADGRCQLWFLEQGLPGYSWYVPKVEGIVNVGIGGSAERLAADKGSLKKHWESLLKKLDRSGLVRNHEFKPRSHSYYLRQNLFDLRRGNAFVIGDSAGLATRDMGEGIGPAIRSGLLAADSIVEGGGCGIAAIPRYSLLRPSLLFESIASSFRS